MTSLALLSLRFTRCSKTPAVVAMLQPLPRSATSGKRRVIDLAEAVRFELTKGFPLPVFKTGAIDHSATPPRTTCRNSQDHAPRPGPPTAEDYTYIAMLSSH